MGCPVNTPQRPDAHRGPSCSCCRKGRVRILVSSPTPSDPDYGMRACPICDCVETPGEAVTPMTPVRGPLVPARKPGT